VIKTKIEHFYGSQENYDLQVVRLKIDTENLNEKEALENGWLIANDDWYACRSVRLNLEEYLSATKKPELPSSIEVKFLWPTQVDDQLKQQLLQIRDDFCKLKNFEWEYDLFSDSTRARWLIMFDGGVPVAFTKMIQYDGGVESQFTAWNYHKPKLSLGRRIVYFEAQAAWDKLNIKDNLYIGQGYERGSLYKTGFAGFEWWTGSQWLTDKEKYEELCARDSTINTLNDLAKVYKNAETI